jgi:hypothetical protein
VLPPIGAAATGGSSNTGLPIGAAATGGRSNTVLPMPSSSRYRTRRVSSNSSEPNDALIVGVTEEKKIGDVEIVTNECVLGVVGERAVATIAATIGTPPPTSTRQTRSRKSKSKMR